MGHGKETPRQKMIGMMYLFLTAMLALNVSKSVLDAFTIIDKGLAKTVANSVNKNAMYYDKFEKAALANEANVVWKDKALEIKAASQKIYEELEQAKKDILKPSGQPETGEGGFTDEKGMVMADLIAAKDNYDLPGQVMVLQGGGPVLKEKLIKYKEKLKSFISESDKGVKESVEKGINTEDPPPVEGAQHSWSSENFEHLPIVATVANLTKMQADVRNVEADMLGYILGKIGADDFKFNKLEGTVIANSSYVQQGSEYAAEVFVAAFDTTQEPVVYVSKKASPPFYDSIKNDDGSVEFKMIGELGVDYDTLSIKDGKGIYNVKANSLGDKKWGGIIEIKKPNGNIAKYPFQSQYKVDKSGVVVSPTKMNVLYRGIQNPIKVSASGFPEDAVSAFMSNSAGWSKRGDEYMAMPGKGRECIVTVQATVEGNKKTIGSEKFRVKNVPPPIAKVNNQTDGNIRKSQLIAQFGVIADLEDFAFDLKFNVISYDVILTVGGFDKIIKVAGWKFSGEVKNYFKKLRKGQQVSIINIKAKGPDKKVRKLSPIVLKVS